MLTQSPVTLTSDNLSATINISISKDSSPESLEILELTLDFFGEQGHRLKLNPSTATITIVDNERKQIITIIRLLK